VTTQQHLRDEVRRVLATDEVRAELAALGEGGPEPDVRPLYRALGRHGLLAVSWPVRYGGRGASHADAAAVVEELVLGGVPDMLHVLSVQIVGLFLLQAGTEQQKARHLPAMASGERYATVLYTEPGVGSDLASLTTAAVRDGDGYRLSGTKVYGLKSGVSDLGLCAVRTSTGATKYDGISLFLIDLAGSGVRRGNIASFADEQYDYVELRDAYAGPGDLLGAEGQGWSLLTRCLAIERTGLDYSLKAQKWFDAAVRGLAADGTDDALLAEIGRHGAAVTAGRLMAWNVTRRLDDSAAPLDPALAAMAKYHTSETAQEVAVWAALTHGPGYLEPDDAAAALLEPAYREAPGLTLSAGTSQIMLDLIASSALERPETATDPVLERLARSLQGALAAADDPRATLADFGAFGFEAPLAADGFELGLGSGVAVAVELGRQALPDIYGPAALAVAAAAAAGDLKTAGAIAAGELAVLAAPLPAAVCASRHADGWRLHGRTVLATGVAGTACLLPVHGPDGVELFLLPAGRWEAAARPGRAGLTVLDLDGLAASGEDRLAALDADPALLARARTRHAGHLLGLALGGYERAVAHARTRRQFDRPLVQNQAVAFGLAQARVRLFALHRLVERAIAAIEPVDDAPADGGGLAAVEAAAFAAQAASDTVRFAVQVHGARGLSRQEPVHAYYPAVRLAASRFGPVRSLWCEAGRRRLDAADRER
jgi:alkylation response protein AidB-like acyl-CoA dehydrogenase